MPAFHARPGPRAGRGSASVRVPGFTLIPGRHLGGSALGWHDHESPTICCVLQGGFTESWRGGSLICSPGTIKVTPAGDRHCDNFGKSDVRGLLVEVSPDRAEAIRPYSAVLDQRRSLQGGPAATIARRLQEELRRSDDAALLAIEGLLLELVATVSRTEAVATSSSSSPSMASRAASSDRRSSSCNRRAMVAAGPPCRERRWSSTAE